MSVIEKSIGLNVPVRMIAIPKFGGMALSCVLLISIVTLNGCQSATGKKAGQTRSGVGASTMGSGKSSTDDYRKSPPCEINTGEAALKAEQNQTQKSHMIRGEVMQVEGSNYVVKVQEGKQVSVQTDVTTAQPDIHQGEHIEASVNEQNHVLWIRTDNSTDRRNEHAASDCAPN